jgi:phosphohistidine phosphatase
MKLYLMQHGEARSKEEDPDRPLSAKGQEDVEFVSAFAAKHLNLSIKQIMHSGKTRAQQTAELAAEQFRPPRGILETGDLEPMADAAVWAKRLKEADDNMMLVGHLPHLSKLASILLCGDAARKVVAFRMGGIVCLERDDVQIWSLAWMITPQALKRGSSAL